jgi:hypothetical protein
VVGAERWGGGGEAGQIHLAVCEASTAQGAMGKYQQCINTRKQYTSTNTQEQGRLPLSQLTSG